MKNMEMCRGKEVGREPLTRGSYRIIIGGTKNETPMDLRDSLHPTPARCQAQ